MRAWVGLDNRLFRHDRRIAINTVRANFTEWRDRAFACAMLIVILAVARFWLDHQPWMIAAWAAFAVGVSAGVGVGGLVAARIDYHSFDGLLAADAMQPSLRRHYMAAWHGIGIATLAAVALIAQPALLVIGLLAYLSGVIVASLATRLAGKRAAFGKNPTVWSIQRQLHRPGAGIVAAIVLLVSLLPIHVLEPKGVAAFFGVESLFLALVITPVDQDIVRFKAISGYRPWRIVLDSSFSLLLFAFLALPLCWLALGPVPAGIFLAASAAMLLLLAMRVLAYCVHHKRFADLVVSIYAGLLMLVAYSMPLFAPFFLVAILWQLHRRAAAKTWLLA